MSVIDRATRFRILEAAGYRCAYCGRAAPEVRLEVDHVIPKSRGGSNRRENLVSSCFDCNRGKRARMVQAPEEHRGPEPRASVVATCRSLVNPVWEIGRFDLHLYAELGLTPLLGDVDPYPADPFAWWCAQVRMAEPRWWAADAVPILWTVQADGKSLRTCEFAPCHATEYGMSWDSFFTTPTTPSGDIIPWAAVPVTLDRFRGFGEAIGWRPLAFELTAPIRSLWQARLPN